MEKTKNNYKKSGVNVALANKFVNYIAKISRKNVKKTKNKLDSQNIGSFGSCYDISKINIKDPVIVSCTDGVGTKLDLANRFKKFDTIGVDLVAMCINDLIVQGAKPLFFLDYIAVGKLNLKKIKLILKGILRGCSISSCELIGGETISLPKRPGEPNCTYADISKIKEQLLWNPQKKFEDGVSEMLKEIEYWKDAPLWDVDGISKATETWFKYMDKEKR